MNLNDLNSLQLAIDTGNKDFFKGDYDEALKELVEEVLDTRAKLDGMSFQEAKSEISKLKDTLENMKSDSVIEWDYDTVKIEGKEHGTRRLKTFENKDSEHPIKIIIKELH